MSLYDLLEVSPKASDAVIRAAYRSLVQHLHPDRRPDDALAGERLARINQAYAVLADPLRRARYDLQAGHAGERRGSGETLAPARRLTGAAAMRPFVFRKFG
jgi:molecular chaperone DnaJ